MQTLVLHVIRNGKPAIREVDIQNTATRAYAEDLALTAGAVCYEVKPSLMVEYDQVAAWAAAHEGWEDEAPIIPYGTSTACRQAILDDPAAFLERVRLTQYARAMEVRHGEA